MNESSPQFMVFQALQCACSQNSELLKPAEQKLIEWEVEPGFYSILLRICTDHTVDATVRWMAAVCFKNGVNKYWRKNAPNEIKGEEKESIKAVLITSLNEPVPQVAVQLAVIISKIARLDCPRDWPELIPTLLETVRSDNQLQQHRALLVLQHVIKTLSSKRLPTDRRIFEELTDNVYSFILNLWDSFITLFFQSIHDQNTALDVSVSYIEKALLALKILRKLTIYGISKPHKSEPCMLFIKAIFQRLKESLECRMRLKVQPRMRNLQELTEKFILKQMKILNEFLEQHPVSAIDFIQTILEFSFNYVFNEGTNMIFEGNTVQFTNFAIHCINLMKRILSNNTYSMSGKISGSVDFSQATKAKMEFFTPERINYICEKIIMHYFILTQSELDAWDEDPESYASDEGGDSWKYELKPCTESFFLTLFNQFRENVIPEVVRYIQKAQMTILTENSDLKDILLKDAIYNAAGLGAFNLFDEVDFDQWFTSQLLDELKIKNNNFRIIRKRAIWLIGQLTGVKFSQALRPQVYAACLELLKPEEDMYIRLTAAKTLMTTMDDFEFNPDAFLPFLEPAFYYLFSLLKEAQECETKMNVLNIMSFIVDKMSNNIYSQIDNLIEYLPLLWDESVNHNMLRCAIISILLQIVKALYDIPPKLAPFLYPVISISTNMDEPSHVYLLEEGLELWLSVIENSNTMTSELLQLCDNVLPIVENSSENLRTVLYIIQSYILLSPQIYLEHHGKNVVSTCSYLLSDIRPEGICMIMKLFEAFLCAKPEFAIELLRPVLPDVFKNVMENKEYSLVMTMYLSILARVLLINQAVFSEIIQGLQQPHAFADILDVWIAKLPLVAQADKRKLLSLALTSLVTVQNDVIFERFGYIILKICETLNDIMKDDDNTGFLTDSLVFSETMDFDNNSEMWPLSTYVEFEYKTHHYERCRQLAMEDPVHKIVLKDFLQSQLFTLRTQIGDERYRNLMMSIDPSVLSNLADFINIEITTNQTIS
ncbi:importin-11 [Lutzomyia longipalpis]|uniref:Putative nuclear transport receptor kap120 importin beta superfamily n=1 Tax=Lutzomyia longipalpis TaxID=7200 RepID=A0A1B0CFH6_LUTLO|nr:importin-11 [Lutzomyia longipalpis]